MSWTLPQFIRALVQLCSVVAALLHIIYVRLQSLGVYGIQMLSPSPSFVIIYYISVFNEFPKTPLGAGTWLQSSYQPSSGRYRVGKMR